MRGKGHNIYILFKLRLIYMRTTLYAHYFICTLLYMNYKVKACDNYDFLKSDV
jgi:hypothetical protein